MRLMPAPPATAVDAPPPLVAFAPPGAGREPVAPPADPGNRHSLFRTGIDLSVYADRVRQPRAGLFHGWGALAHPLEETPFDLILVTVPWETTFPELEGEREWATVEREIDEVVAAGKEVYLYPHPAFPPAWTGLPVNHDDGCGCWIDYFTPEAHRHQLAWTERIARRYGHDPRVTAIRMSSFRHGEAHTDGLGAASLTARSAAGEGTIEELAEPYLDRLYAVYLEHCDPVKLVTHGGGLGGTAAGIRAVRAGAGHGNGTTPLDFAGANHFPRPEDRELAGGHLVIRSARGEDPGVPAPLYVSERQCGEAWNQRGDAFTRWLLFQLCHAVVLKIDYLMLPEFLLNAESYRRPASWSYMDVDRSGRPTRRGNESNLTWEHNPWAVQAALWCRTMLGVTEATTPEAFVQFSRHWSAALKTHVEHLGLGARIDPNADPGTPTEEFDAGNGTPYQQEIFGHRLSTFARRTDRMRGCDRLGVCLDPAFTAAEPMGPGPLYEVRVSHRDDGLEPVELTLEGPGAEGLRVDPALSHPCGNTGGWVTSCFLLTAERPRTAPLERLVVRPTGSSELTVSLVRVLKINP